MLSAAPSLSSRGTLYVPGTPQDDRIIVSFAGANVRVTVGDDASSFERSLVQRVIVEAGGGHDLVMNKTTLRSTLAGGAGNETLFGGRGPDLLSGNAGNDRMYASDGHDTISGGAGRDAVDYSIAPAGIQIRTAVTLGMEGFTFRLSLPFYVGGPPITPDNAELPETGKRDLVDGQTVEILVLSPFDDGMQFEPTQPSFATGAPVTIYGGPGNDGFFTDPEEFVCFGEDGDDFFSDDILTGGQSTFFGGNGDDTLAADPATTDFDMGPGNNWLAYDVRFGNVQLGPGNLQNVYGVQGASGLTVTILGDDGPNVITTENLGIIDPSPPTFPLRLIGNGGDDTIVGGDGDDSILGGDGDDCLFGGQGRDVLRGGDGNDFIDPGPGNDTIYGGGGNDTILANRGRNRVYGGDGDDTIFARDGRRDTLYGEAGNDAASFDAGPGVLDLVDGIETIL